jgi:hypothetical protein
MTGNVVILAIKVAVIGLYVVILALPIACKEEAVTTEPRAVIKFGCAVETETPSASFNAEVPILALNVALSLGVTAETVPDLTLYKPMRYLFCSRENILGFVDGIAETPSKNLPLDTSRNSS